MDTKIQSETKAESKVPSKVPSKAASRKPSHTEEDGEEGSHKSEAEEGSQKGSEHEENNEEGSDSNEDSDEDSYDANSEEDEDEEYEDFFAESEFGNTGRCNFTHELEREELKWEKRAEWLEVMLLKIKENCVTKAWIPWFEAKLQQLFDLDVPIKSQKSSHTSNIFYLHKFIEEQITPFNPETQYHKDQRVYPEDHHTYPKVIVDASYSLNESCPSYRGWSNLRTKLCTRINARENATDYILTVFEKKNFGNEKLYEKRLNFRKKRLNDYELVMHPNGGYIYFKFNLDLGDW